ncbi:MAG: 4-hydroxy-3-methylbut-2-en-1-yl diphosphate synthase [Candidatus Xenolissoclinum pacificiensis L6]|uniref:4-hydroxy-3-methylbut-2-en-1-yl diphosphate synthase n=1 Tax=Candidatus Xenolissoclinum pacificiensis L6 TaxID=1401685 RepID=W2UZ86_9RICK|nr:MAG: 4-hydroxy-3-methylbut-2-en-1-yl diphosphate synthase [Candidatus Xenolissoclinum pacificiensis L6]
MYTKIDDILHEIYEVHTKSKRISKVNVKVRNLYIGSDYPVVIQSMTSGLRSNPKDIKQVGIDEVTEAIDLIKYGAEMVRIAINSRVAMQAVPYIRDRLDNAGYAHIPLVGCGQYEIAKLVHDYPECANKLDKIRINPGNIDTKENINFVNTIEKAIQYNKPVRIGVNGGSIDKKMISYITDLSARNQNPVSETLKLETTCMLVSSIYSTRQAEIIGLPRDKIVLSCKTSNVRQLIIVYELLDKILPYPLHLGLTEAGMGIRGHVATSTALGVLLHQKIGDTIRCSITPDVTTGTRESEIQVCKQILQSLELRQFHPEVISCPGCGRTNSRYFQELATDVKKYIDLKCKTDWKHYKNIETLIVAVMGCIVNGPGESRSAHIGISLPGYGEKTSAAVFANGEYLVTLKGEKIKEQFLEILDKYVQSNFEETLAKGVASK